MKQQTKKSSIITEGAGALSLVFAFLLLSLLLSYNSEDPTPFYATDTNETHNLIGKTGAWLAAYLYYWFGFAAYLLVGWLAFVGCAFFYHIPSHSSVYVRVIKRLALLLCLLTSATLLTLHVNETTLPASAGGIIGSIIAQKVTTALGFFGSNILLLTLFLISFSLITGLSWLQFLEIIGGLILFIKAKLLRNSLGNIPLIPKQLAVNIFASFNHRSLLKTREAAPSPVPNRRVEPHFVFMPGQGTQVEVEDAKQPPIDISDKPSQTPTKESINPAAELKVMRPTKSIKTSKTNQPQRQPIIDEKPKISEPPQQPPAQTLPPTHSPAATENNCRLPSVGYLHAAEPSVNNLSAEEYQSLGEQLVASLKDFGVIVELKGYKPGPVVTLFELEPAAGVKASRISALSQDLARSMAVENVRVLEFISGKSVIGIEIPNQQRKTVRMQELLTTPEYQQFAEPLPLALGQDIAGKPVITSLAAMPHLLVAGTTGSGKSIGINAMLITLLYRYGPQALKLMLIDPKMLELSVYNDIPHLLVPVITDMTKAAQGLNWCVKEMDERYGLMAQLGVRNIESYNDAVAKQAATEDKAPLPYLVIVIDEFADLIMTDKKVEDLIVRLAQKARAAGIHIIIATQRPSVNVVTGLIKANIPARISFKVSARIDSRTVLDQSGAEQLLGKGDMLFSSTGGGQLKRVHGVFIEDSEIRQVVAHWKQQGQPNYQEQILIPSSSADSSPQDSDDELYTEAVDFVRENNRVSISSVQRKFKIGYNRAARIIELMEKNGLVSSMDHSGKRTVLA